MKYRKLVALLMAAIMTVSLAACGGESGDDTDGNGGNSQQQDDPGEEGANEEIPTATLHLFTVGVPAEEAIAGVEQAMNDYCDENGLKVHYDIDIRELNDYGSQIDMALAAEEEIGIFMPSNFATAVSRNQVLPLDDYLDNELKDAVEVLSEGDLLPSTVNGHVYAIPNQKGNMLIPYFICNADVVEALDYDVSQIKTIYDLEPLLAAVHEAYPDMAPLVTTLESALATTDTYMIQNLGNGACIVGDSMEVSNYYASDYYREAVELMYDWAQKGYVMQDLSTSTEFYRELISSGKGFGGFCTYGNNTESVEMMHDAQGMNSLAIPLGETYKTAAGVQWAIGYTCKDPAAAALALNYLYTEEFLMNTLIYGLEGVDWVYADEAEDIVTYPEGVTGVPYNMWLLCGVIGNQFILKPFEGNSTAEDIAFMQENNEKLIPVPAFGFSLDATNITTQCSAVNNVVQQYDVVLRTGEVNPEEYLPIFLEALEGAGVNDIIEEAQGQLEEWSAQQ